MRKPWTSLNGRSGSAVAAAAVERDVVIGDVEGDTAGQAADRALERVVLEGLQAPAPVTDQMVVVAAALRFVAGDAVADLDAGQQVEADELVDDAVDRGASDAPALALTQPVLDVQRAERAGLLVEQLDHRLAGAPPPKAGAGEALKRVLGPVGHQLP